MTARLRQSDRRLASGKVARVLRIDPERFEVLPLFTERATPAEDRLAQVLGEARLGKALAAVPPAAVRMAQPALRDLPGIGPVTCLAERARAPAPGTAPAAPLHLLRLAASRLEPGEVLVNANHFLFLPPELDGPWNAYGDPIGLTLSGGVVKTPPQARRACLLMTRAGAAIRRLGFADVTVQLPDGRTAIPHPFGPPAQNAPLTAFALFHGTQDAATPAGSGVWDVAFVGRHAVALKQGGGMPVPRAGCVVRLASKAEAEALAADPITYDLGGQMVQAVQAGPIIVENGAVTDTGRDVFAEEMMRADPTRPDAAPISPHGWAADWHKTRAARLSAGITKTGALFFCAVEGSSSYFQGKSDAQGASLHDLAELMAKEGAVTAMHLDGGGSTQVFCDGGGALLTPRDVHHGMPDSSAQFDRPLPLALKLG